VKKSELLKLGKKATDLNHKARGATREFENALNDFIGTEYLYHEVDEGAFDMFIDHVLQGDGTFSSQDLDEIISDLKRGRDKFKKSIDDFNKKLK